MFRDRSKRIRGFGIGVAGGGEAEVKVVNLGGSGIVVARFRRISSKERVWASTVLLILQSLK